MDPERAASDWLRAIRGRRSQRGFSRRLGYKSNIAYRWESGVCFPTAREVFATLSRSGTDVEAAAKMFVRGEHSDDVKLALTQVAGIAAFLRELRGEASILELARRTGFSRFAISRWLKGAAEPRLPEFLALVEGATLRGLDFIACFADPGVMPSLAAEWHALEAARSVAYAVPWSPAVLRVLELEAYRALGTHRRGFIAARIGITLDEEDRCLAALKTARQIRRRRGRWVVDRTRLVDTRVLPKQSRAVRAHWMRVALARLEAGDPGTFGYNVMALSVADLERLRELHLAYFHDMQAIVAGSAQSERVVLFNTQLVELDRLGRAP